MCPVRSGSLPGTPFWVARGFSSAWRAGLRCLFPAVCEQSSAGQKGGRFTPAGGCGGGLERWSELEYVPKSGSGKAVLAEPSSLLHTLPLQEPSGHHSPCSGAGLWHNVHGVCWHTGSEPRRPLLLAMHGHSSGVCALPHPLPGWSIPGLAGAVQAACGKPQGELKAWAGRA